MRDDFTVVISAFDTPIKIRPGFWGALAVLWALMTWMVGRDRPDRPFLVRGLIGFLAVLAVASADVGHATAHIFSARQVKAPMDEIILSQGMPRTIYHDSTVSPRAHRGRALGGPLFSGMSFLIVAVSRRVAPEGSLSREILTWAAVAHGLIFLGSLAPIPYVDGGSILKWTLVEAGVSQDEADVFVEEASLALGLGAVGSGAILAARRRWLPGLGLIAGGVVALLSGLGRLR